MATAEIEKLDIYKTKTPNAPSHDLYPRRRLEGGSSSQVAYMAEVFINAGAHFVALDFNNVTEIGGSIFPMVDQVRRAVAWVYQNAKSFGGDPARIYSPAIPPADISAAASSSPNGKRSALPRDIVKGALLGSGMYDLKAPRLSKRSQYVAFTDAMEQELSPRCGTSTGSTRR